MEETKVKVRSTVKHEVSVAVPELNFRRNWPKADSVVSINKDILEELMNDVGFKYMIDTGMLYIDSMEIKKDLGIEPDDATEPTNVIVLSDKEKDYYLNTFSVAVFKEKVEKLSRNQIMELCDYAIEKRFMGIEKCNILKNLCGKNIIKAIELDEANKEN